MRAVVGLRNPGSEYAGTRHNVGHEVVATLAERFGERFRRGPSRVRGEIAQHGDVLLLIPSTFVNESGQAVSGAIAYFKVAPANLLIVHDDIDLDLGRLRLQANRGSGGHNGIRSVERSLGTREFSRLKVGVGRPPGRLDPAAYVLRPFTKAERAEMDLVVLEAADLIERWLEDPQSAVTKTRGPKSGAVGA
jgi:peptidyl-tRNA hydrolase, PTH1 family